ncbi:MAG: hypothetical protein FJ147_27405 [Deltaproteobacteria bacterium]|nr:hypothetical protein [Deltaproteobacteria bacterium]
MYYTNSAEIRFFVSAWNRGVARASINPTVWNHIVGTYNGSRVQIYVNGVEGTAANFTGPFPHGGTLLFGKLPGGSSRHNLDEVQFFNRALSPTEVQSLYSSFFPPVDTAAPLRTNGAPTGTLATGTIQTTLALSTNENATCRYGTAAGASYTTLPHVFSATGGVLHDVTVSALQNGQSYTFYVRCQDSTGNTNPDDFLLTFAVAAPPPPPPDTTPPVISNVSGSEITSSGITITWLTDEPSDTQIEYGPTAAYGQVTVLDNVHVIGHSTQLSGLAANTTYHYRVHSRDAAGNRSTSNAFMFTTDTAAGPPSAMGPLTVNPVNPRYLMDGTGKIVFLAGLADGWELQDFAWTEGTATLFDYTSYLDYFQSRNLNHIRMWVVEHTKVRDADLYLTTPMPFVRTGPGLANDGLPKFDLTRFNQEYFDRLRNRVIAARNRGIYVTVMLFDYIGSISWPWNMYNFANNINYVNDNYTLTNPTITIEEAYLRKVIDTVNDLDNVIYEICNECPVSAKDWQYYLANYIKSYQATKPQQHPVMISYFAAGRAGTMAALYASPADIIAAGDDGGVFDYERNPPASDGRKVVIADSDHITGDLLKDRFWPWKCFTRGLYPMYMDRFTPERYDPVNNTFVVEPFDPLREGVRVALGRAKRYADRMDLAHAIPRNDLCSTQYCLVKPGSEYLIYLPPEANFSVSVDLTTAPGAYSVEWFNPVADETRSGGTIAGGTVVSLTSPFPTWDSVLYLRKQ